MSYLFSGSGSASKAVSARWATPSSTGRRGSRQASRSSRHTPAGIFFTLSCFRHFALTQKKGGRVGRGPLRASVQAQKVHRPLRLPQRRESPSARTELVVSRISRNGVVALVFRLLQHSRVSQHVPQIEICLRTLRLSFH